MSKSKAFSEHVRALGWPPLMPMRMATTYTSVSKWTIKRAVARGELAVAGRRGRDLMFQRVDLDRWLLGQHANEESANAIPVVGTRTTSRVATEETNAALSRLARMGVRGQGR